MLVLRKLLGFHIVGDEIDVAKLEKAAIDIGTKADLRTARIGIFCLRVMSSKHFYCRTRTGFLFPSLFYLRVNGDVEAIPHPIRIVGGVIALLFVVLLMFVSAVLLLSALKEQNQGMIIATIGGIVSVAGVFLAAAYTFLRLEKVALLAGFKKLIGKASP